MNRKKLDNLYVRVSEAIRSAERLEDERSADAPQAFRILSRIEEQIARITHVTNTEGEIARCGAINGAIKAGDTARALKLFWRYAFEKGGDESFLRNILELLGNNPHIREILTRSGKV